MKVVLKERYIVCVDKATYFAGPNEKYSDMSNLNLRKYAYCFSDKEFADKKAAAMCKGGWLNAKVEKVFSNYYGYWKGNCCILGEEYTQYELNL